MKTAKVLRRHVASDAHLDRVEVNGRRGLLVTGQPEPRQVGGTAPRQRARSVLVWAAADKVFAIHGPGDGFAILSMAQSVR